MTNWTPFPSQQDNGLASSAKGIGKILRPPQPQPDKYKGLDYWGYKVLVNSIDKVDGAEVLTFSVCPPDAKTHLDDNEKEALKKTYSIPYLNKEFMLPESPTTIKQAGRYGWLFLELEVIEEFRIGELRAVKSPWRHSM
ncbi:MAG: hypothetical protein IT384_00750 [Deltaproteobacteria bacterium]|nr:hypothetical protein [Deltaproteobacteria bacterium]